MNTLSWLIYAAEIIGNLSVILGIVSVAAIGLAFVIFVGRMISGGFVYDSDMPTEFKPHGSRDYQIWMAWKGRSAKPALVLGITLMILCAFIPSPKTVYMIAGSEAGETVVTSPDAIEMMGDLKAIIKKRLKDELGEVAK